MRKSRGSPWSASGPPGAGRGRSPLTAHKVRARHAPSYASVRLWPRLVAEALRRLVGIDDPEALASETTWLLGDPGLRRTLGARGAVLVRDYDWNTIAARLESIEYRSPLRPVDARRPA